MDVSIDYKRGLAELSNRLKEQYNSESKIYLEFTTLEARLLGNLYEETTFGSDERVRSDRQRIIFELNKLSISVLDSSFNQFCGVVDGRDEFDLGIYLVQVIERYKEWEQKYTPLTVTFDLKLAKWRGEDLLQQSMSVDEQIELGVKDAAEAYDKLVILGDPGSGKTTALKRLAWEYAQSTLVSDPQALVPVFIPLNEFPSGAIGTARSILEIVHRSFKDVSELVGKGISLDEADQFLRNHTLIFLLDGLNELADGPLKRCVASINDFIKQFPQHRYVVTSRKFNYAPRNFDFTTLEVLLLKPTDIKDFLGRYLESEQKAAALVDKLSPRLRHVARNPLFLYIIARVYLHKGKIPSREGQLLRIFVYESLRDNPFALNQFDVDLKYSIAEELGLTIQGTSQVIEWDRVVKCVDVALASYGGTGNPADLIKELCDNHVLERVSHNQIRFWHQVIQEYFAASRLVINWKRVTDEHISFLPGSESRPVRMINKQFGKLIIDRDWREPLLMMIDLLDQGRGENFIKEMVMGKDIVFAAKLSTHLEDNKRLERPVINKLKGRIKYAEYWGYGIVIFTSCAFLLPTLSFVIDLFSGSPTPVLSGATKVSSELYNGWYDLIADNFNLSSTYPTVVGIAAVLLTMITAIGVANFVFGQGVEKFEQWVHRRFLEPVLFAVATLQSVSAKSFLLEMYNRVQDNWFIIPEFTESAARMLSEAGLFRLDDMEELSSKAPLITSLKIFEYSQAQNVDAFETLFRYISNEDTNNTVYAISVLLEFVQKGIGERLRAVNTLDEIRRDRNRMHSTRVACHKALKRLGVRGTRPWLSPKDLLRIAQDSANALESTVKGFSSLLIITIFLFLTPFAVFWLYDYLSPKLFRFTAWGWIACVIAIVFFRPDHSVVLSPKLWGQRVSLVYASVTEQPYTMMEALVYEFHQQKLSGKVRLLMSISFGLFLYIYFSIYLVNHFPINLLLNLAWVLICLWSLSYVVIRTAPELWAVNLARFFLTVFLLPMAMLISTSNSVADYWSSSGSLWIQRRLHRL